MRLYFTTIYGGHFMLQIKILPYEPYEEDIKFEAGLFN